MKGKLSRKILSMILSFAVVFSMLPGAVFAESGESSEISDTLKIARAEIEQTVDAWGMSELTDNLIFPEETSNGCEVAWKSSYTSYLTNTGEVKRPNIGYSDGKGTLTATIYDKAESTTAEFPFVVKAVQASELEQAAKESLELYLDQLQDNEKLYGDLTLFEGKKLNCYPTSTNFTKGIVMPVYFGGNNRNVYVTVAGDNDEVISEAVYSGTSYGKNGKVVLSVTRETEDRNVKLTFTMNATSNNENWTVEKNVVVAAKASESEMLQAKADAEKAFAAIEDYNGDNEETLQTEVKAAQEAADAAYRAGWSLEEISAWKNYDRIEMTQKLLENREYTVKLTIQGYNKGDLYPDGDGSEAAYFIKAQPFTVKAGWSVYDVLKAATDHYGMSLGGSSSYVSSIAGLSEKMLGSTSGWMYMVNTTGYINTGMGNYKVSDGDSVLIYYVKDWGSKPVCSFDEISEWSDGKSAINLLGSNDLETLEKDWEAIKAKLDATAEWYSDLPMPVRGENNSRIVWKSSDPDIVSESGKVTRGEDPADVILTATLYAGSQKLVKTYNVKIGGTKGITVTVKIEGKDEPSSLDSWTGRVVGGSVSQYDSTVTYSGYGDYILPGHALMTRLKASDENFKFNDAEGLKSASAGMMYATIDTLFNVKSGDDGRYWCLQVVSKDGSVKFLSNKGNSLYFAEGARLAEGDTLTFRYTASLKDLKTVVTRAKGMAENNYTAEAYAVLKAALEKGNALVENEFSANQEDVDAAANEIEQAIVGLEINVDLLAELPKMLRTLAESESWQAANGDGYGVLALSRAGLYMTENGLAKFVNGANSDLKNTYTSRPNGGMMRSALGMTALGKDLNYYIPQGGSKSALAQMWQDSYTSTNTSSMSLGCWLLISRTGAYPELKEGDRTAVEKRLLSLFDETAGGWRGSYKSIDIEYTAYAVMALADAYADSTNENHEAAVEKVDKAVESLKAGYTASTGFSNRAYIAMALLAMGQDPEAVKFEETGLISSFAPNLLADRTGFTESADGTGYSGNTPTAVLVLQMYKEFKETGKAVNLNVYNTYPAEAKAALNNALAEAEALDAEDYTEASYKPLAEAIQTAKEGLYSIKTTAEQAAEYKKALEDARAELAEAKDTIGLEQVIAEAKAIDLEKYDYTEASKKALTDALSAAETVLTETDISQSRINAAETSLREAIDGLQVSGEEEIDKIIKAISQKWISEKASVTDDWRIVDMAMLGKADALFESETDLHHYVSNAINRINPLSVTDYERVLIAVTALGIDGSRLDEYRTFYDKNGNVVENLVAAIQAFPESAMSVNGATFALLAFDSGEYEVKDGVWSRENLISYLLKQQLENGGWNLQSDGEADPDVTAMAISAIAPYTKNNKDAEDAVDKALGTLSRLQDKNGEYASYDTVNSNSSAMVMIALASAGRDAANDEAFVKWSKGSRNSVLSGLLTFKTSANQFGYDNNRTANALSTEQGLRALAAYRSYLYAKATVQPYAFGKPDSTEKWEEEAVAVSLEIVKEPSKMTYQKGEQFEPSGLSVRITFSDGAVIEPAVSELDIIGFDSVTTGTKTVKIQYKNVYATLQVKIEGNSTVPSSKVVYLRVADPQGKTYFEKQELTYEQGETAFSVLAKAGLSYRPNRNTKYEGVYVEAIEGLGEFDCGPNSGWMYRVNGYFPNYSASLYELKAGDYVEWLYTRDLGKDIGNSYYEDSASEDVKTVTTTGTDTKITTAPTEVKVSGNTATAAVTDENVKELLKQAKENKSAEIIINISASDVKDAETVKLELDKKTAESIVNDTEATVTVKTPAGEIGLDKETLKQIAGEAEGNTIVIEITKVSKPEEAQKTLIGTNGNMYRLTVKSGNKVISDFRGTVTVRLAVPAALKDKNTAAVYIRDGALEKLEGKRITRNKEEFYEFTTNRFGEFALVDTAEVKLDGDDNRAENIDKAKSLIKELKLSAVSSKTTKKNIKVTVKMSSRNKTLIKEIGDMGFTVKYKYYRSVKKASKYKALKTKTARTFVNTKGKKGTKYYYKVKVVVYDGDKVIAQSALKQCKYAVRTWSK